MAVIRCLKLLIRWVRSLEERDTMIIGERMVSGFV